MSELKHKGKLREVWQAEKSKERMKRFGKVDIPTKAFTVMLKRDLGHMI